MKIAVKLRMLESNIDVKKGRVIKKSVRSVRQVRKVISKLLESR